MSKKKKTKSSGAQQATGRVTLKPCPDREDEQFCAPLNHIEIGDSENYWVCSCGRRYSSFAYKKFAKATTGWIDR